MIAALKREGEILRHFLDKPRVERDPFVAVAFDITIFTALCQQRWRDMPAAAKRRDTVTCEAPGVRFGEQSPVRTDTFHFGTQAVTVQHCRFGRPFTQAVEAVVMQPDQRMNAFIRGIGFDRVAVGILTVVVVLGAHPAHHHLQRTHKVIHAQNVVLNVVVDLFFAAKVTPVNGEIAAEIVIPFDVIDPAAGPGEEHHVRIEPVDIEVIAVKTLTCPEGTALQRPAEIRQAAQLGKRLTNIQIAGVG
ncbi:hypothetical protein D3C78_1197140 [compost metagenome]